MKCVPFVLPCDNKFFETDSDIICLQDLNLRKKFQDQLEGLIKMKTENKSKIVSNNEPLGKKELYFKNVEQLSEEINQQRSQEIALLKEQSECSKRISEIDKIIEATKESLQKLKNEDSLGKDERKQLKKPLLKAIKKYSINFGINVEVKKHDTDTFEASLKLSTQKVSKAVDFLIDRKNRGILGFNAESLLSNDEIEDINNALTENGLDVVLSKLRDGL